MQKGVTLKDIARKLNMSISTVSKSLSNDASISPLTQQRVKDLASQWGYVPNEAARNFKLKKSLTIGPFGGIIKNSDDLWKTLTFVRSRYSGDPAYKFGAPPESD